MNLEDVKKFLADNKEQSDVKAYLNELSAVSADKVTGYLDTEEGKRLLQPRLDRHFHTGLETWKTNNLEGLIEAEVSKRNPAKTPEQKRIEELEKKIADAERASQRQELVNKALKVAKEKNLPDSLVDFFIADDEEKTIANLSTFEEVFTGAVSKSVDEKFKQGGRHLPSGQGTDNSVGAQFAQRNNPVQSDPNTKTIWD